jgi:hypothetical protein
LDWAPYPGALVLAPVVRSAFRIMEDAAEITAFKKSHSRIFSTSLFILIRTSAAQSQGGIGATVTEQLYA